MVYNSKTTAFSEGQISTNTSSHVISTERALNARSVIAQFGRFPRATSTIHILEGDLSLRAQFSHRLVALGLHVEIYSNLAELVEFNPDTGIILVNEDMPANGMANFSDFILRSLCGVPIIVYSTQPSVAKAVAAMKARAIDYLDLNDSDETLMAAIEDAKAHAERNRERNAVTQSSLLRIQRLSQRERQVLEFLIEGLSNKEIARRLDLSPRTVEIHRMHMMNKLDAKTPAEAVGLWYAANI